MSNLRIDIGAPFGRRRDGPEGWLIIVKTGLILGVELLAPDIAG